MLGALIMSLTSLVVVRDYNDTTKYTGHLCNNIILYQNKKQVQSTIWYEGEMLMYCPNIDKNVTFRLPPQRRIVHSSKSQVNDWLSMHGHGGTFIGLVKNPYDTYPEGITETLSTVVWWMCALTLGFSIYVSLTCIILYILFYPQSYCIHPR